MEVEITRKQMQEIRNWLERQEVYFAPLYNELRISPNYEELEPILGEEAITRLRLRMEVQLKVVDD